LRELTAVPERTERQYEQVADVATKRNIAIGEWYSKEAIEERAWRQGQAAFRYLDTNGKQRAPGREYVAWHMPNSYDGPTASVAQDARRRSTDN